ncbi:cupin domain-containing protein [Hoeflea sp. TYP-13]|uniref:cupin domain-containing protein n=1 Tax=Hoeflea sp. TYP-13 TaxID=3230023 RepID=UPI0034C6C68E
MEILLAAKATRKKSTELARPNSASEQVEEIVSRVGEKLMRLRSEQKLSLQQLAAKSDVSGPAIHKIERSGMVPTITTLLKLSNALGVPVNYFTEEDEALPEPVHFTKGSERGTVFTPHKGLDLEGITGPYRQFRSAAAVAHMKPGANSGRKRLKHPGEELVHVTSGEVYFQLGGKEYSLKAGDSLHFSGEIPHQWANTTDKPAELIWVVLRDE